MTTSAAPACAQSGKYAFEDDDLVCALRRDVARAVVLESPADRRRYDKQRAVRELEAARTLEREESARKRDERDCRPQTLRDGFAENEQRNQRRRHNLEVAE